MASALQQKVVPPSVPAPPKDALLDYIVGLREKGELEQALEHWKFLLAINPAVDAVKPFLDHVSLLLWRHADELSRRDQFDEALIFYNYGLHASPTHVLEILNNAATCLAAMGRLTESTAAYEKALELKPNFAKAQSGLMLGLNYKPGIASSALHAIYAAWDQNYGKAAYRQPETYANGKDPKRKLRIGFVSGDFWKHPVGVFLVRFLENLDSKQYSLHCYSLNTYEDHLTQRFRDTCDSYEDVHILADQALADKIQKDEIDILIDLGGHTGMNRLGMFALKPAPVQMSWLGHPGCTGLSTIDYVIADRHVLPLTMQNVTRAKILHLPDSFLCYDPLPLAPEVSPLPAQAPGEVTFGCFNNPIKCNRYVVELWAEILKRLPQSKLLFKYRGFSALSVQANFKAQFEALGVDPARLEFQGVSPISKMFATIARADIALDPFPFAGGMMSCLTLWMGVPIITMPGDTFASRQGLSFLSTIGLTETIASDSKDYCEKAVALAINLERLSTLRKKLRPAIEASALCDGPKAAKGLDVLLRKAWRDWCKT